MNRPLNFILLWLIPHLSFAGGMITGVSTPVGEKTNFFPSKQIRMEVAFDHEFEVTEGSDSEIEVSKVWFYCRWTNIGKRDTKILLKDHDDYHGTLDYPWGLQVRITGKNGKVFTTNDGFGSWWSSSAVQSQFSKIRPGDVVALKQGESVVRRVPLERILLGLDFKTSDLQLLADEGYSIEVQLGGIVAIKPLTLRPEKKPEESLPVQKTTPVVTQTIQPVQQR